MNDNISILKPSEVLNLTSYSTSGLRRQVLDGLFPPQINLGSRSTGYIAEEVQMVLTARSIGMNDTQIRAIVNKLVEHRQVRASRLLEGLDEHSKG
mgnify:CR=1 FL=1